MCETVITLMLQKYPTETEYDKKNALKEVLQEIILVSLSKIGFFEKAAFNGGTALRMFYGLTRFSEDLDFSLKSTDTTFKLEDFLPELEKEINLFGLHVNVTTKEKKKDSPIKQAFIRGNTREYFINFYGDGSKIAKTENIKIRFEIDLEPPDYATFEHKEIWIPSSSSNVYKILIYDAPSLFAGKIHAVLDRKWHSRVKGRDLYDYVFYITKKIKVNLKHLIARLVASGCLTSETNYTLDYIKRMLHTKFNDIDFSQAKDDVRDFLKDISCLEQWNSHFFQNLTQELDAYPIK